MLAVAVGIVLLAVKFSAFYITNSNTILSDALESIVNVAAGSFALYSLILASKPRDREHPYGHGKIEFISAGIEGTLILIAGIGIIYKSVESLVMGNQLNELDQGMYMAGAAGLVNFVLGAITEHYGNTNNSPTMIASGKHLKSDGYTSTGMIIGLVIVYVTGWVWMDSAIAMAFGLFIGVIGVKEMRKSVAGIMDEANFDLIENLIGQLNENRKLDRHSQLSGAEIRETHSHRLSYNGTELPNRGGSTQRDRCHGAPCGRAPSAWRGDVHSH